MKYAAILLSALVLVWLALSGHYTPLMIGLGALSCLGIVVLCMQMGVVDRESVFVHLAPGIIFYIPWLLKEIVLANLDVARRILHPKLPIEPSVIRLRASQRTELGRFIYANSITLTPGTLTLRLSGDGLLVHALSRNSARMLQEGHMARRVEGLPGES